MTLQHAALSLATLALLGLCPTPSRAEPNSDGTEALDKTADILFEEGQALMKAGKYADACAKFEAAQRIAPGAGVLANLGLCSEKQDKHASAWGYYTAAAERAAQTGHPDFEAEARELALALEPVLSKLTIGVPPALLSEGVVVTLSGVPLAPRRYGTDLPLDGGTYEIVVAAPGYQSWKRTVQLRTEADRVGVEVPMLEELPSTLTVTLSSGASTVRGLTITVDDEVLRTRGKPVSMTPTAHQVRVTAHGYAPWTATITLGGKGDAQTLEVPALARAAALPAASPADQDQGASRAGTWTTWGYVLGGVGVVTTGVGVTLVGLAAGDLGTANSRCPDKMCTNEADFAVVQDGTAKSVAATVLVPAGIGLAAVGIWLALTGDSSEAAATRAAIVPLIGSEELGVRYRHAF